MSDVEKLRILLEKAKSAENVSQAEHDSAVVQAFVKGIKSKDKTKQAEFEAMVEEFTNTSKTSPGFPPDRYKRSLFLEPRIDLICKKLEELET